MFRATIPRDCRPVSFGPRTTVSLQFLNELARSPARKESLTGSRQEIESTVHSSQRDQSWPKQNKSAGATTAKDERPAPAAQEFLASHEIGTKEEIDARKTRYGADDIAEVLKGMTKLIVAKGKKITEVDLKKDKPDDETLTKLMIGPTGNLRAPTMRIGKTVLVGFNEDAYKGVFG